MIDIRMFKKMSLQGFTFIEGFPGIGLVGPMAISYMIDKLGMEYVGYVDSHDFPPIVSIHKNTPMPPIRVYASEKSKVVTIFAEFAIPLELTREMSEAVYAMMTSTGISRIFSIGGMPIQTPQSGIYVTASTPALLKEAQKAGLMPIGEGVATGVSALLLVRATIDKLSDINIMVPIEQAIINPKYAKAAIESLKKLMKLSIDTSDLDKEAKLVEAKIREIIKKHAESHDTYKKTVEGSGPSMYA